MSAQPENTAADVAEDEHPQTLGEQMMGHTADVPAGQSTLVDDIKDKTKELIDIADGLKENDPRLSALAIQYYEIAEHFAVKAALS